MTKSYTFNGKIDTNYEAWEQWMNDALTMCEKLGYKANYYDFSIVGKLSGKVHPISGMKRKLLNIKKRGDKIKGMTILALPEEYDSASSDYIITLSRNETYVTLILNQDYEMNIDEPMLINRLRKNINASSGEMYEMDIYDCPEFYAAKLKPQSSFKSLKVVDIF